MFVFQWCLAINNIDYVRQSIQPFVKELGLDDIIKKLAEFQSHSAAEHCRETLQLVLDNAVETVKNKILDLLETVVEKVSTSCSGERDFLLCYLTKLHLTANDIITLKLLINFLLW